MKIACFEKKIAYKVIAQLQSKKKKTALHQPFAYWCKTTINEHLFN